MNDIVIEAQAINGILRDYKDVWSNTRKLRTNEDLRFLKIYAVKLAARNIPVDVVQSAMIKLAGEEVFYPALALIISTCEQIISNISGNRIMDADEAWSTIMESLKNGSHIQWTQHLKNAVEYLGGLAMISQCRTDTVAVIRAQFREGYNSSVRREREDRAFKQAVASLPESVQKQLLTTGKTIEVS